LAASLDTPVVRKRILRALLLGGSCSAAAAAGSIGERTFFRWQKEKSDFADLVARARGRSEMYHLRFIARNKDWRAHAWFLERRFPGGYQAAAKTPATASRGRAKRDLDDQARKRLLELVQGDRQDARRAGPGEDGRARRRREDAG
jgi:hypothetical protein